MSTRGKKQSRQTWNYAPCTHTRYWGHISFSSRKFCRLAFKGICLMNLLFSPFTVRSPRRNFYGTLTSFTKVKDACTSSPVLALCSSLKASKVAKKSRSASSTVAPSPKNPKGNCSLQYTLYQPAPLFSTCASYSFI